MNISLNHDLLDEGLTRISEAAQFLCVSRSFIYTLIRSGALPSVRIGRNRRIPIRAIRELAAANLVRPQSIA